VETFRLNLDDIPSEKFPLLVHFHYLEIYRTQLIKQADTIMAMFLLGHQFSLEIKKRNFDYYDPLTTGDSSLSACVQSIVAAEVGDFEKELKYFEFAAVMDLADVAGNVVDGAHLASIGGTWMALVYGFGGFRDFDGRFTFNPRLPSEWEFLRFPLTIRGQTLEVDIRKDEVTYTLTKGSGLTIEHAGEVIELAPNKPVKKATRAM
jgi:alpha,alpha-trehalose phosphorylase